MESSAKPQHIRPKVRSKPVVKSADELDTLLEETRQRLQSWTAVSSTLDTTSTASQKTETRSPTSSASSKQTVDAQRNAQPNPKGILRAPKYSSKDAAMREPTMKSPAETSESLGEKPRAAAVKDLVVERNPVPQVTSKPDARSIEGYTPKTKDSPMVISSLSDLMGAAGTLPDQHTSTPQVVEADLSFACMTETEYEETVKYAASVDPNELDADLKERGDVIYKDDQGDSFDEEDDDEDSEARSDKDDENEDPLLGLDELEEALPAPEPRAFMTLWTAIKDWITPEAVVLIQKWREMNLTYSTLPDWEPQVDRSDVGASRCAGLMSMLKMHLSHSLEELHGRKKTCRNTAC